MKRIHIIGGKNHGKTTLIAELLQELTSQGLRIGTIKHTHHHHELDAPGKDSHRHREAGAAVVGILSRSMNAVFWQPESTEDKSSDERYSVFAPTFADCTLTLVEGDKQTSSLKIEVWRESLGTEPLAASNPSITAVVTHDKLPEGINAQRWPRADVVDLAARLLALASE